jgi:hypothetical protein
MKSQMRDWVDQYSDECVMGDESNGLLAMDGYDDCIAGIVRRFNDTFVLYDHQKVIAKLMAQGMSEDEAVEFWEFNQVGGWHGDHTVGFLLKPPEG